MKNETPLYQLLAAKLGRDPVQDMRERRENGESWRSIMIAYLNVGVSVTDVTLRSWYAQAQDEAEVAAR